MPSKNMLPKGKRRQTVKHLYRATRGVDPEPEFDAASVQVPLLDEEELEAENGVRSFAVDAAGAGLRLDQYLAKAIPEISRSRVQLLVDAGQVTVNGKKEKASLKLLGGELIAIEGEPRPEPLKAFAEDIPLDIVYEDASLAVINKPAAMMVHAGAGATEDERNHGTLVNALLGHFKKLSGVGGELRPGIVHRLDKQTSGLIIVAKNDVTHRRLSEMFSAHAFEKIYVALVHGWPVKDTGTVNKPISRDTMRRMRMTTKNADGRSAVSHWKVLERINSEFGKFALVEVKIETGRTHQIRVHMQSLTHPVVGDTLYGAATILRAGNRELELGRNFLHAAKLKFDHPKTKKSVELEAQLPAELLDFMKELRGEKA